MALRADAMRPREFAVAFYRRTAERTVQSDETAETDETAERAFHWSTAP